MHVCRNTKIFLFHSLRPTHTVWWRFRCLYVLMCTTSHHIFYSLYAQCTSMHIQRDRHMHTQTDTHIQVIDYTLYRCTRRCVCITFVWRSLQLVDIFIYFFLRMLTRELCESWFLRINTEWIVFVTNRELHWNYCPITVQFVLPNCWRRKRRSNLSAKQKYFQLWIRSNRKLFFFYQILEN